MIVKSPETRVTEISLTSFPQITFVTFAYKEHTIHYIGFGRVWQRSIPDMISIVKERMIVI
ncbi:hypothetical protein CE91St58_32690 [Lachnospiraceae bacterium]|nr:hypothetical protein CE91St58_32690 [Lachnospiraceae bacterium]